MSGLYDESIDLAERMDNAADEIAALTAERDVLQGPICHKCHGNSITHAQFCPLYNKAKELESLAIAADRQLKARDPAWLRAALASSHST